MAATSLERTVECVFGDQETNQDTMRILADMGLDICSTWHVHDTPEANGRMNEQLFVIFNTMKANLQAYNTLLTEAMTLTRAKA